MHFHRHFRNAQTAQDARGRRPPESSGFKKMIFDFIIASRSVLTWNH